MKQKNVCLQHTFDFLDGSTVQWRRINTEQKEHDYFTVTIRLPQIVTEIYQQIKGPASAKASLHLLNKEKKERGIK